MKEILISILIYFGLLQPQIVPTPVVPIPNVIVGISTKSTNKVVIDQPKIKSTETFTETLKEPKVKQPETQSIVFEIATSTITTEVIAPMYDEIRIPDWSIDYRIDGVQVLTTFQAPIYTYGGQKLNTLKCYQGGLEILKIGDKFSFYSSGYGGTVYCKLDYYRLTIKRDLQFKEYVPIDFEKIKGMLE